MLAYTFIFIFLLYCVYNFDIRNKTKGRFVSYVFSFFILVLMVSLRYRVGGDSQFYDDYYTEMPSLSNVKFFIQFENNGFQQPLWIIINAICKSISDSVILFQFFHAILFNVILFIFANRYSSKPFSVIFLFYVSLFYFYYSFEIQRETMAVAVFLLNVKNLEEKKWLKYYILVFVSFLFHISAFILIFLPFFYLVEFNKKMVLILLFASVLLSTFRTQLLNSFDVLLFLEVMKEKKDVYSDSASVLNLTGIIVYFVLRVFLFLPIAFKMSTQNDESYKFKWFYSSFFIISVFCQFFNGFERFLNYLFPIYFIICIQFIYFSYPKIKSMLVRHFLLVTLLFHIFFALEFKLFIVNAYGEHYYSLFFPYESVFDPKINEERESFYESVFLLAP